MGDIGKSMARGDTLGCEKEIFQTEGDIEVNGEGIKENGESNFGVVEDIELTNGNKRGK